MIRSIINIKKTIAVLLSLLFCLGFFPVHAQQAQSSDKQPSVSNFSEIAPLKKVLIQRPGDEFLNLTPNSLESLLFDDIPFLKVAQQEHDTLADVLRAQGVEVVYLTDLFAQALDAGGPELRQQFLRQFISEAGVTSPEIAEKCYEFLNSFEDNKDMAAKCIAGTDITEIKDLNSPAGFYCMTMALIRGE